MLHVSLEVNEPDTDVHELTAIQSYMFIEPEESYLAYGSCKLPFRMITGDYGELPHPVKGWCFLLQLG